MRWLTRAFVFASTYAERRARGRNGIVGSGIFDICSVPTSGTGQPEPLVRANVIFTSPSAWSRDYFVYTQLEEPNGWDAWPRSFTIVTNWQAALPR